MKATNMVTDNLMSPHEMLAYIQTSFGVDVTKINKLKVHTEIETLPKEGAELIPHHRYKLYLSEQGVLHIGPSEGLLRVEHFALQMQCLSVLLDKSIPCSVVGDYNFEQKAQDILSKIEAHIVRGKAIDGVIVGSPWNINYLLNKRLHPGMLDELLRQIDGNDLDEYVVFRARQSALEDLVLKHKISMTDTELSLFREGALPSQQEMQIVKDACERFSATGLTQVIERYINDSEFREYVSLDYMFFSDLINGTDLFSKTLESKETSILTADGLTYQLIHLGDSTVLNVGWMHAGVLGELVRQLQNAHPLRSFHMYGKCGALTEDLAIGDLVAPVSTTQDNKTLVINNMVTVTPAARFSCVMSPLVETNAWAELMKAQDITCVEMELHPIYEHLTPEVRQAVVYYVSDKPLDDYKIGQRWSFLEQKLACSNLLLDDILSVYTPRHL